MKKLSIGSMLIAILLGVVLFGMKNLGLNENLLMYLAFIPYFLFTLGLIAWLFEYKWRKLSSLWQMIFPLLMGIVFVVLLAIHIFILEPYLCPCLR